MSTATAEGTPCRACRTNSAESMHSTTVDAMMKTITTGFQKRCSIATWLPAAAAAPAIIGASADACWARMVAVAARRAAASRDALAATLRASRASLAEAEPQRLQAITARVHADFGKLKQLKDLAAAAASGNANGPTKSALRALLAQGSPPPHEPPSVLASREISRRIAACVQQQ